MTSNIKFKFCNYTSLFVVMLRSEKLLPNLLIKCTLSSVKLIRKRTLYVDCHWISKI